MTGQVLYKLTTNNPSIQLPENMVLFFSRQDITHSTRLIVILYNKKSSSLKFIPETLHPWILGLVAPTSSDAVFNRKQTIQPSKYYIVLSANQIPHLLTQLSLATGTFATVFAPENKPLWTRSDHRATERSSKRSETPSNGKWLLIWRGRQPYCLQTDKMDIQLNSSGAGFVAHFGHQELNSLALHLRDLFLY